MVTELKRSIGLSLLCFYGLGTVLGAGIYVLVGKVAAVAGLYAPVAFLVASLIALLTGLSYAELSARFPKSAGEAVYVQQAFGLNWLSGVMGWAVVLTGLVSAATICRGFVGYLQVFVPIVPEVAISLLALVLIAIAVWGITESLMLAAAITLLEVFGLLLVLFSSSEYFSVLPERWPELIPPLDLVAWLPILSGAFLAFYAFIGFEDMVNIAEEVKAPQQNMPKAIVLVLLIAMPLYVLVALVAVMALPLSELATSKAPLVDILSKNGGADVQWIALISLVAVVNGALIQLIMASRVVYGLAEQGNAPAWLAFVHPKFRTPLPATLLLGGIIWLLALIFPLVKLAQLTSLIILVVFFCVNISLVFIKRQGVNSPTVSYPVWVPLLAALMCALLVAVQVGSAVAGMN